MLQSLWVTLACSLNSLMVLAIDRFDFCIELDTIVDFSVSFKQWCLVLFLKLS